MKGLLNRFRFWGRSPLTIVEFLIAISTIIGGLYVISPALVYSVAVNGATPLVTALGSTIGIWIFGGFFTLSGIIMLYGLIKRNYKIRSAGLFMNILGRTYGLVVNFMITGLLPLTWLAPLTVLAISVVCYIVVRGFINRGVLRDI